MHMSWCGWRCTSRGSRGQVHGHCDVEERLIEILFVSEDDDALDMLLIHEISHAVASLGHGKTWKHAGSPSAAATAGKLGRTRLAELLDQEIDNYRNRGGGIAQIYAEVRMPCSTTRTSLSRRSSDGGETYGLHFGEVGKVFRGLGESREGPK